MAYRYDQYDSSLVIDGFQNGVADSPFDGLADIRNMNVISVPGEASVNFATESATPTTITNATVASAAADVLTFSAPVALSAGQAIYFSSVSGFGGAVVANTTYWVADLNLAIPTTVKLYSDYAMDNVVVISVTGTGTFSSYAFEKGVNGGRNVYPDAATKDNAGDYYMADALGKVWSTVAPGTGNTFWRYMGNKVAPGYSYGNGLVYYQASNGDGYLFLFNATSIDYLKTNATVSWVYQWDFRNGTVGAYSATPTTILNPGGINYDLVSHDSLVGQDNTVYFCDGQFIGSFFEKPLKIFSPIDITTYTPAPKALTLPVVDRANCLAELGVNLLIGGQRNLIYPWDRTSTSFTYPIWIAESVIQRMITINTNTFIFVGNRGRIYITNGSQANLYKKVPDHISGTVEPYYTWGGVASTKNQLYFGVLVTTNAGTAINQYGGMWAIDMDTKAIRLVNKLSYGTYAGFACSMIPVLQNVNTAINNPSGTGFYTAWYDGVSACGIDRTISTPYTGSQASFDSDLIPIGTYQKTRDFERVEYRLTKPMVSGESITINYRLDFSQSWTPILTDSTAGHFSLTGPVNFKNAQWLQLQAVINSTATNPSYTRLKEIRIVGIK